MFVKYTNAHFEGEIYLGALDLSRAILWEETELSSDYDEFTLALRPLQEDILRGLYVLLRRRFSLYTPFYANMAYMRRMYIENIEGTQFQLFNHVLIAPRVIKQVLYIEGSFIDGIPF